MCISRAFSLKLLGWNGFLEYIFHVSMVCNSFSVENYLNKIQTRQNVEKMLNVAILLMMRAETLTKWSILFCLKVTDNLSIDTSKITPTPHRFTPNTLILTDCWFSNHFFPSPYTLLSESPIISNSKLGNTRVKQAFFWQSSFLFKFLIYVNQNIFKSQRTVMLNFKISFPKSPPLLHQ